MAGFDRVSISFDDEYKLRVLEEEKFKHTEELAKECTGFVTKINEFSGTVNTLVGIMDTQAQKIERWKLKVRIVCYESFAPTLIRLLHRRQSASATR